MSCRNCEDRPIADPRPADPAPLWGAERISGMRCSRCGALLGADDIARLLLEKQSQLERFGLLNASRLPPGVPALRLETD